MKEEITEVGKSQLNSNHNNNLAKKYQWMLKLWVKF